MLPIGALWTVTTAVAEATAIADAAASGKTETFQEWWAFAEAMGSGITFLALAVAVIAGNEIWSSERVVPVWSAWTAMIASLASFAGWAVGMWIGIGLGNLVWQISTLLMTVWTLWFGLALARSQTGVVTGRAADRAKKSRAGVWPAGLYMIEQG